MTCVFHNPEGDKKFLHWKENGLIKHSPFEENDRKIQSIEINRKTENELLINFSPEGQDGKCRGWI